MSFFAIPPEYWPLVRERLPRPLTREDAVIDLRWWQDRELQGIEQMPSYRKLGFSWGWSQSEKQDCKRARLLLADEVEWSDPYKLEEWRAHRGRNGGAPPGPNKGGPDSKGRNEGANGAQTGRSEGANLNGKTPALDEKGRNEGANGAQTGRSEGDTRDPFSRSQSTSTERESTRARGAGPEGAQPPANDACETGTDPIWLFKGSGLGSAQVKEIVCRISALIRARPVKETEARADAPHVRAVFELDPTRTLLELAAEVEVVARWAQSAPEGRDDLGGLRPNGVRWGMDRSHRVSAVLDPKKWLDRLDAARRWAAGAEPPAQRRGWHPGVPEPQTDAEREEALQILATFDVVQ